MKTYTFITILSVFLIFSVFLFGAIVTPNEKVPLSVVVILVSIVVNFGIWVSIIITKELID